jgi:type IV pilus assembly protein PilN
MRVSLNLATRPFTDLGPAMKRLRIGMGVLAGVSLLLLVGLHALHQKAQEARAREHSLDGAVARINNERQGYQAMMLQPDNARFMGEVTALNQHFDEKAFSWTLAMENLETVLPGGVQVTQIEPARNKEGQIILHLRVLGPHDLAVDLMRNLEHSRRFMSPRIEGENAESSNTNARGQQQEPVSLSNQFEFDLLADYIPPTPEERAAIESAAARSAAKTPPPASETSASENGRPANPPPASRRVSPQRGNLPRQPYVGTKNPVPPARPNAAGNSAPQAGPQ